MTGAIQAAGARTHGEGDVVTDAQALMRAARLIEYRGFTKGIPSDGAGRLCAIGALNLVTSGDAWDGRGWAIADHVWGASALLVQFNNRPETTQDEVIALLESGAYSVS